jgi:nitrite reductase (cytochrome c-552)
MSEPVTPRRGRRGWILYLGTIIVTAAATYGVVALLMNIAERKREAQEYYLKLAELSEDTVDPAEWGKNFPRQYDGYRRTAENTNRRHGGSEALSRLDEDPRLRRIFAGYPFSVDYRERRGHAFMLEDQDNTERVHRFKQPGACLHCHASILPAYRQVGGGDVTQGFQEVCAMPLKEARKLVSHPVSCVDCHDPGTTRLRVTRPAFISAMKELARSDDPVPHFPSVEQWRKGRRDQDYDVNALASRQEMRSFACGQCHVEYYFKGEGKLVTYPWNRGLKVEQMERYYDDAHFKDWVHAETGAAILKAQHPEFELWSQGIHARSGVSCADCHMPYVRQGAVKITDHQIRSPLLNVSRACQTCHRYSEAEIKGRAQAIQDRHMALMDRAEDALVQMLDAFKEAKARGASAAQLAEAQALQRRAQWRVDFINAENSLGFHASQEGARILGEAIDYARQAQVSVLRRP